MSFRIKWDAGQVIANMKRIRKQFQPDVAQDFRAELEIEKTEVERRTPVDTGALRSSEFVEVEEEGNKIIGRIGAGGPAAPYALQVHEDLNAFHKVGQAKFIESVLNESGPYLSERVAKRRRRRPLF